ncbi:MAG: ROK family protein [Thaumarchaeota archaeon]|jgi:fructokinase|nr:ROK family protein [Nitrososphaerota archaeon]MBT3743103.1 ROK family protein [Nitrososphaerota archaeon]MBT4510019.1 ROK family protein [Nitrososphaerota archaeon]MBT4675437.1 ROK family protein [Nitrososphaerota archaeon]MBT4973279.1 ROK family protein [Nitrososphaerota archaeon]
MKKIGIDLGGTKIEGILVDDNYKTITRKRIPTNQDNGYNSILESIKNLCMELMPESNENISIGVCTPGALSLNSGLIKNSNTQCLIGKDLQNDLKNILHHDISIENDANCFALAEANLGAGKDSNLVFGVIMGTGVGGGITINGKIHHGRNNIAGEWGHHCLHNDGNRCYCGNSGCVETYISGPSLEQNWSQLSGLNQSLPEILQNFNNQHFQNWKKSFIDNFALSLSNVIDILDPDMIILGGGLSNIDFLYDEAKNAVYDKVFSDAVDTPIVKNLLGDSAGVFGACLL